MDKIVASTSESEKYLCDLINKNLALNNSDNVKPKVTSKCVRASCGNSSFTAGTNKREISRINTLNRSFNNATFIASNFRRKICNRFSEIGTDNNNNETDRIRVSNSLLASKNITYNDLDVNNLQSNAPKALYNEENRISLNSEFPSDDLVWSFSQRVKRQVQSSLSEPIKNLDLKSSKCELLCETCSQCKTPRNSFRFHLSNKLNAVHSETSPLARTSSVRKTMAMFSNRLQLPKFMTDNEPDSKNSNKTIKICKNCVKF